MKMRRKLAALLASAMIVSVMPMTAFAASTNRVSHDVVENDYIKDDGSALVIELKDGDKLAKGDTFFVELENAEWEMKDDANYWGTTQAAISLESPGNLELKKLDPKTLEVKATDAVTGSIRIPLVTKITGAKAYVMVDGNGTAVSSAMGDKKILFALEKDSKAKANVTVADAKVFVGKGEAAKVTIKDLPTITDANKIVEIELNQKEDFNFKDVSSTKLITLVGKRGFNGVNLTARNADGKLTFVLPTTLSGNGYFELENLEVEALGNAKEGDVTAYISGKAINNKTVTLAKFGDYSTNLTTEKVQDYTSGRAETVKFTLEQIGNAVYSGRRTTFTFPEDVKVSEVIKVGDMDAADIAKINTDKKDNEFEVADLGAKMTDKDKFEFEVKLEIPANFKGDLFVKAEGKSLDKVKEVKLAEVKAPVTVKVEAMSIKAGTRGNKGGKITITETDKGMLKRDTLVIKLPKELMDDGVKFQNVKDLDIKTTGGITVKDATYTTSTAAIEIEITRQSNEEAGSIEISGFEVEAKRAIIDGAYKIEIGGKAISELTTATSIDAIAAADFILVGNVAKTVVFKIGETDFTVNGKTITMDAAARISNGRTMVPLRYLSYALGIDEESIKFNSGVVTIFKDAGTIIQVRNGDNNLTVNGMTIPMTAAAEIVEGRTYVPVTEIGSIFGVTGEWDAAAQTATFK